mgnify:CR=1 FL=1
MSGERREKFSGYITDFCFDEAMRWMRARGAAREPFFCYVPLHAAHAPESEADLLPTTIPRRRLAYDELLANSLALMLVRADNRKRKGQPLQGNGTYRGKLALPFPLTGAQRRSIA